MTRPFATMALSILLVSLLLSTVQAKVGFGPGDQEWGYVNVREGAHMFWWLYYADIPNPLSRPLILFLMGGPGGSSTGHGNFEYIGLRDSNLVNRNSSWVKNFNILFIDSPVGAGFSYVENLRFLSNDNEEMAKDLVECIKRFYIDLPRFRNIPLYIYGQGYGGKMGTDFVWLLHKAIMSHEIDANLKALSMGNSWLSPITVTQSYSDYLYQVGLIDEAGTTKLKLQTNYTEKMYNEGKYYQATREWMRTLNLIYAITDGVDFGNILTKMPRLTIMDEEKFERYVAETLTNSKDSYDLTDLMNGDVKKALNITNSVIWGSQAINVFENLYVDFMINATNSVELILNGTNIQIHICNGNMNLVTDTPGELQIIRSLSWINGSDFKNAPRSSIYAEGVKEGYKKVGGGMNFYWFNAAGSEFITENVAATRAFLFSMTGF